MSGGERRISSINSMLVNGGNIAQLVLDDYKFPGASRCIPHVMPYHTKPTFPSFLGLTTGLKTHHF